jgi:hypothetical protein
MADELANLSPQAQATLRAGLLMQQILRDADAAKALQPIVEKAAKAANPAYQTVEDVAAPIVERVRKEFTEELAKRDKKTADERAVADLQTQISIAKDTDGLTDEGIANILKQMQDKGVGDFEIAKKAYLHDRPSPSSTPGTSSDQMHWNAYETMAAGDQKPFFFPEGMPSISDRPEVWERETAIKYLNGQVELPTS